MAIPVRTSLGRERRVLAPVWIHVWYHSLQRKQVSTCLLLTDNVGDERHVVCLS